MGILQIRFNNDEVLRKKCKEVICVDDRIRRILNDMMDTLRLYENGAALAANQVGILRRLVVVDYGEHVFKLVNPKIIGQSEIQETIEGCLSFPNVFGKTVRPAKVTIQALNENGEEIIVTGEGELAKCLCHEVEHLDGELFVDKVFEFIDVSSLCIEN